MPFQLTKIMRVTVAALLLLMVASVSAQEDERWSMSVLLGGHLPAMHDLSNGLYRSPMLGDATILLYEGGNTQSTDTQVIDQNITEKRNFTVVNPAPPVGIGANAGIEFMWHPNDRHALAIGMGSWEKVSIGKTITVLPIQQYYQSNVVYSERRDKMSYTEYTLGWRYTVVKRPGFNFYTRINFHEVFDIDFREDYSFLFLSSPVEGLEGVRRTMVVQAQTASLFMGQLAVGGEWFLTDWLSLGVEAGYMASERRFKLKDVQINDDFLDTPVLDSDLINRFGLPYRRLSDGTLGYLIPGTVPDDFKKIDPLTNATVDPEQYYAPIILGFDGWRVMFRVSFYY